MRRKRSEHVATTPEAGNGRRIAFYKKRTLKGHKNMNKPPLPKYVEELTCIKIVQSNESLDIREDLVAGMEFDNAKGDFDNIGVGKDFNERAETSGRQFVRAFEK